MEQDRDWPEPRCSLLTLNGVTSGLVCVALPVVIDSLCDVLGNDLIFVRIW